MPLIASRAVMIDERWPEGLAADNIASPILQSNPAIVSPPSHAD